MISNLDFNNRPQKQKKVPLIRIVFILAILYGVWLQFSDNEATEKASVSSSESAQAKPAIKSSAEATKPTVLVEKYHSIKQIKKKNGSLETDIHFLENRPILSDTLTFLNSEMINLANEALVKTAQRRRHLKVRFNQKNDTIQKVTIFSGKKPNSHFPHYRDSVKYWLNKSGCSFPNPCFQYPGRSSLHKTNDQFALLFKSKKGRSIKPVLSGTISSIDTIGTKGVISIHHGGGLTSTYSNIPLTNIEAKAGKLATTGTTIGTYPAKGITLRLHKNGSPINFISLWKKSYPIASSEKLKEFVNTHFIK